MLTPAEDLAVDLTLGGLGSATTARRCCTRRTARARLRRRGRAAQHPGGRAVALRRHRRPTAPRWRRPRRSSPTLDALVAGATTAADAIAAIDAYFASPAAASTPPATSASTDDLTPVDIGEGQRLDYGMRADEDADRRAAARPGARRRWWPTAPSPATRPSRWRCSARPASGRSTPRRALLDLRAEVGILQERGRERQGVAHLRARDARAGARQDRRDRSAGGGLDLPAARDAARVDLHGDLAARRACASPTSCA